MDIPRPTSALHPGSPPELTPTEQEVLEEYERLADNMKKLASLLDTLASNPTVEILDGLRELERKTSLVFTLLKASVYSIVLQQEMGWGGGVDQQQQQQQQQQQHQEGDHYDDDDDDE